MELWIIHLLRLPHLVLTRQNSILSCSHHVHLVIWPSDNPWLTVTDPTCVWHIKLEHAATTVVLGKYIFVNLVLDFRVLLFSVNVRIVFIVNVLLFMLFFRFWIYIFGLEVRLFAEELLLVCFLVSHLFVVSLFRILFGLLWLWVQWFCLFVMHVVPELLDFGPGIIPFIASLILLILEVFPFVKFWVHRGASLEQLVVVSPSKMLFVAFLRRPTRLTARLLSYGPLQRDTPTLWLFISASPWLALAFPSSWTLFF